MINKEQLQAVCSLAHIGSLDPESEEEAIRMYAYYCLESKEVQKQVLVSLLRKAKKNYELLGLLFDANGDSNGN